MVRALFLKYSEQLLSGLWKALHHRAAFPLAFLACAAFWLVFATVDLPFKAKTAPEWAVGAYLDNWRLHANTKELMIAKDKKDIITVECRELKQQIKELRLARWQLMGSNNMHPKVMAVEVEMILAELGDTKKKLRAAELDLRAASLSYDTLIAQR